MRSSTNIAVDVMGADLGPEEVIEGVAMALKEYPDLPDLTLVGNTRELDPILEKKGLLDHPKVSVVHASEVIEMDEKPIQALKQKKDSSMVRAIELVKEGVCDALLSCGNTGALMAGSTLRLRTLPGVERPAISAALPAEDSTVVIIDVGAHPESTPRQLVHNAILGVCHSQAVVGIERPRVGLLTIGTEEGKGTKRIQKTHEYLKSMGDVINYIGPMEGFYIFQGAADVVVCDGFVGNILLKTSQSIFRMMKNVIKREHQKSLKGKISAVLSKSAYARVERQFSSKSVGAAPFLGLNGVVMKAHGSSNRVAVKSSLITTSKLLSHNMNKMASEALEAANAIVDGFEAVEDFQG